MSEQFPYLLSPLKIGPVTVRNRMMISAHHTKLGDANTYWGEAGLLGERYAYYVAERAKGGVGLIVLGQLAVHPTTRFEVLNCSVAYNEAAIPGLKLAVDMCHQHGTKVFAQLFHSGFHGTSDVDGTPVWSASDTASPPLALGGEVAKPMEREDIEELKQYYALGARHAKLAGVDGMEIHAAHGYLLAQFLSPLWNRRTDEYGGSLENRMRLLVEIIETVRAEIGPGLALGARVSGDEFIPGGLTLEDMQDVARRLDEHGGLDYLSVSQGQASKFFVIVPPMSTPHGGFAHLAGGIREVVDRLKICTVGRIVDPAEAEQILANGYADMVIMTRANLADPEIANKTRDGRLDEIRPCLGDCSCTGKRGAITRCAQNPTAGRERELGPLQPAARRKRVMIVGGGPGGLEASWVAAARGHDVTLYEKSDDLGGQIRLAKQLPTRGELDGLIRWRRTMLKKHGVKVVLGTEVTAELLTREQPEAVVIATGSTPRRDGFNPFTYQVVPGWEGPNVVTPEDVLSGRSQAGQHVVVYDVQSHFRGIGITERLAAEGKSVHFVFPVATPCPMLDEHTKDATLPRLIKLGVDLCPSTLILGIEGSTVSAINTMSRQEREFEDVDTVVMVGDGKAETNLYEAVKGTVPELYRIGDAQAPRTMQSAVRDGHVVGRRI